MEGCRPRLYFFVSLFTEGLQTLINSAGNIVGTQKKCWLKELCPEDGQDKWHSLQNVGFKKVYSSGERRGGCCALSPDWSLIIGAFSIFLMYYMKPYMALLRKRKLPLHSNVRISRKIMFYQVNYSSLILESSVMHCSLLINNAKKIARKDKGQRFILHNLYVNLINCTQWYLGMWRWLWHRKVLTMASISCVETNSWREHPFSCLLYLPAGKMWAGRGKYSSQNKADDSRIYNNNL